MPREDSSNLTWGLVSEFRALWETCKSPPDVFRFLGARPGAGSTERVDVLRIDQHYRWLRGEPLALQVYLKRLPDIATRPDLVRLLVESDQSCRSEVGAAHKVPEGIEAGALSDTPTQIFRTPRDDAETITEERAAAGQKRPVTSEARRPRTPGTTRDGLPSAADDRLDFDLDSSIESFDDIAFLGPILDPARFTLLRRIGAGGMGVVFEAYDEERGELVALKTMRRVDPTALERFKQEFRTLSDITHQNLVSLYRLFAIDGCWFFTMELVEGCDFLTYVRGPSLREPELETQCVSPIRDRPRAEHSKPPERPVAAEHTGPPGFDEPRLRDALTQLALGVHTLHLAGKLHRDIKPTNVMVTPSGRVVLLDFGLTIDLEPPGRQPGADRQVVGTLAHMSPEQALGRPVTAASDWYSVGVILYQALTGRLPFEGTFDEVVLQKQSSAPLCPDQIVAGLPAELVELCMDLLHCDAVHRPCGSRILERLRGRAEPIAHIHAVGRTIPLIGRSWHRQVLEAAFASLAEFRTATVFVLGRTGTGKTTVVRAFLDELIEGEDAVVLFGRCYEQEWVPFKAVDSIVDALAKHLRRLSAAELERLLPRDAFLLARMFPVLRAVPGVLQTRRHDSELPDPQELRLRIFAALRELLFRLGNETRLVIMIDDLQWGDLDSAVLLADLLHRPDPPPMLFIGCFRLEDARESRFLHALRQAGAQAASPLNHRELAVEALSQAESRELALALLDRDDSLARAQAHVIARESRGNPLFINELVRYIQSGAVPEGWDTTGEIELLSVLWTRIQAQPVNAQRLLEIVSVSGRPILESLAFRAAELGTECRAALGSLRSARLIRGTGRDRLDEIEIYHDRIRETVLAHLAPATLRRHHELLACVLESSGQADAEVLADHYHGAGHGPQARVYYLQAGDKASAALAFDHAARLYRRALEQKGGTPAQQRHLGRKLGDALSRSGRGAEAASVYLCAAEGATAAETLELKRLASTQLLISGQVDQGLALLKTILGPLGLSMPSSPRGALVSLIRHRAMLRLRGLRFRARDETQVSAEDLTRIDLCWSAVAGLSVIDPILGADFQTRGLLLALHAGEPFRIARSVAMEAANRATEGVRAASRVESLLSFAEKLAGRLDSPGTHGVISMSRGVSALLLGRWKLAQTCFDNGESLLRNHCTGVTWERDTSRNLALLALLQMGKMTELKRRWSLLIKEALEFGDRYASTTLTTFYLAAIRLAADDPSGIEEEIESVMGEWTRRRFFIQHSSAFRSLMYLDLYRGRADSAWQRVNAVWPEYSRSLLLRIQMIRIQMLELRARAALALAETAADPHTLLQSAQRDAGKLAREGQPWALAHAHFIEAGIAGCRGESVTAQHHLVIAAERYDAADMHLNGWVMRYRIGEIQGDTEGRTLIAEADAAIRSESIVSPSRWSEMVAPGFSKIAQCQVETRY